MLVTNGKVAIAHYITGGFDDIVVAAGPDDLEIVKMDVLQTSEEAQSEVLRDADALFFVYGESSVCINSGDRFFQKTVGDQIIPRAGQPGEVADAVMFLLQKRLHHRHSDGRRRTRTPTVTDCAESFNKLVPYHFDAQGPDETEARDT
jgi:hypothetical protein